MWSTPRTRVETISTPLATLSSHLNAFAAGAIASVPITPTSAFSHSTISPWFGIHEAADMQQLETIGDYYEPRVRHNPEPTGPLVNQDGRQITMHPTDHSETSVRPPGPDFLGRHGKISPM
jgi:hypothetical protein